MRKTPALVFGACGLLLLLVAVSTTSSFEAENAVELEGPAAAVAGGPQAGPGIRKLDAKFSSEEDAEAKHEESQLQAALAADAKRINHYNTADGLSPHEAKTRDHLHKSIGESTARVSKIAQQEADASSSRTAIAAARLLAANKRASEHLAHVNKEEKEDDAVEFQKNVVDIGKRIKDNGVNVENAAKEEQHDDTDYIAGLKSSINKHGALISSIENDEFHHNHVAMRKREEETAKHGKDLDAAVAASSGPAGLSERESKYQRSLQKSIAEDASLVSKAADSEKEDDSSVIARLMARNKKALECVQKKGEC